MNVVPVGIKVVALTLAAVVCGGCATSSYFHTTATLPTEAPWQSSGHNCGQRWMSQSCFNITAADFRGYGYLAGRGGPLIALLWLPGFVIDVPISLCADVVSTPWQIARHNRLPECGILGAAESDRDEPYYMSPLVPQLLRGLKVKQDEDGSWSCKTNRLAGTSLAVLALAMHGDTAWGNPQTQEFVPTFARGAEALRKCADMQNGRIRFQGEEDDLRAFLMAAAATIEVAGLAHDEAWRTLAEKCVTRLADEEFPFLAGELNEKSVESLRWFVMSVEMAKAHQLCPAKCDERLEYAKSRLKGWEKGDDGVYDTWREHCALIAREPDAVERWREGDKRRMAKIRRGVHNLQDPVTDEAGNLRWAGLVVVHEGRSGDKWIRPSGLGEIADTALLILPFAWPESCARLESESAKQKACE